MKCPFRFSDYKSIGCPDLSFHGESAWILEPVAGRMTLGMLYCGEYAQDGENTEDVYVGYNFFLRHVCSCIAEAFERGTLVYGD